MAPGADKKKAKNRVAGMQGRGGSGGGVGRGYGGRGAAADVATTASTTTATTAPARSVALRAAGKNERVRLAVDTWNILHSGGYTNMEQGVVDVRGALDAAVKGAVHYSPEALESYEALVAQSLKDRVFTPMPVRVTLEGTTDAALRLKTQHPNDHVGFLNFASAKNPGGGWQTGAQAQEEAIARASGLYPTLKKFEKEMYDDNRRGAPAPFYSHHMIYSPEVPIFRGPGDVLLDNYVTASAVSAPACNFSVGGPCERREGEAIMAERAARVLAVAALHRVDHLVLGAWGCGVFKNVPDNIAAMFAALLARRFSTAFKSVTFAILSRDKQLIGAFEKKFGKAVDGKNA